MFGLANIKEEHTVDAQQAKRQFILRHSKRHQADGMSVAPSLWRDGLCLPKIATQTYLHIAYGA